MTRRPVADRFWDKVWLGDGCWLWTGAQTNGYGVFNDGCKIVRAHRWSYEFLIGPIPEGLHLDHLCREPRCVNPEHLEPVTQAENTRRGVGITVAYAARTACTNGHEFTPDNTGPGRGGSRTCRACRRDSERKRRLARSA